MNLILNEMVLKEIEELLEEKSAAKNLEEITVKDVLDIILTSFGIDSTDMVEASKRFDKECLNKSMKHEKYFSKNSINYARTYHSNELFQKILANATLLLFFLYLRFYHRVSNGMDMYFQLARMEGSDYYRADMFIKDLDVTLSLKDFLSQLVFKVIELHDTAAIRKLYTQGGHSWWYLKEGNRLFFERNYPTNPREMPGFHDHICNNVLQILIDLKLVKRDVNGMYSLTKDGEKWVGRYG